MSERHGRQILRERAKQKKKKNKIFSRATIDNEALTISRFLILRIIITVRQHKKKKNKMKENKYCNLN